MATPTTISNPSTMRFKISILMYRQDDPNKCTASKLVKFDIAREVKRIPFNFMVLNPFSKTILTSKDKEKFKGICAIDCSWKLALDVISSSKKQFTYNGRRLPALLAGNPTNYAKVGMLSTAEALSASLYILNYKEHSYELMNKFKWGHTFHELNSEILEDYARATEQQEIEMIEKEYFPHLFTN